VTAHKHPPIDTDIIRDAVVSGPSTENQDGPETWHGGHAVSSKTNTEIRPEHGSDTSLSTRDIAALFSRDSTTAIHQPLSRNQMLTVHWRAY
jgi:hypothetical protein